MNFAAGRTGFTFTAIASTWNSSEERGEPHELRVELLFVSREAKRFFAELEKRRDEVERDLGESLAWHNPPESQSAKVYVRQDADLRDQGRWETYHAWHDTSVCPACGGHMKIIAALTDPASIRTYLEGVGLPARAPPVAPARPHPQHELEFAA